MQSCKGTTEGCPSYGQCPALCAEVEAKVRAMKNRADMVNEEEFEIDDEDDFDIRTLEESDD